MFRLDDLIIDTARQRVTRDGVALDVGGLTFQLFAYLLSRGDAVVGHDELIAHVWAPAIVNEETVTQRVKLLRQALGDDGRNPRYVRAVRGRGYQLCASPVVVDDDPRAQRLAARAAATVAAATPSREASQPYGVSLRASLVLGCVLLVGGIVLLTTQDRDVATVPATGTASAATGTAETGESELVARARHYQRIGQKDDNERAIALFEQALARDADDRAARAGLAFAYAARVCLYDFEWKWAERAGEIADALIAQQPDDHLAFAARGYAHDCLGDIDGATAAYARAIAIDPVARRDSAGSLAHIYAVQGRLADALRLNRAIEASGTTLRFLDLQLARNLELLGDVAGAERRYRHSFDLQLDNVFSNAAWPAFLFRQGRFAEAEAALAVARERPFHPELLVTAGEIALVRGDTAAAATAFADASARRPHQARPRTLAMLYGAAPVDARKAARRIAALREAIADGERWPDAWIELAWLEESRGDRAAAMQALDGAVGAGFLDRAWLQTTPLLRGPRESPAFAGVLDAIAARVARERDAAAKDGWQP